VSKWRILTIFRGPGGIRDSIFYLAFPPKEQDKEKGRVQENNIMVQLTTAMAVSAALAIAVRVIMGCLSRRAVAAGMAHAQQQGYGAPRLIGSHTSDAKRAQNKDDPSDPDAALQRALEAVPPSLASPALVQPRHRWTQRALAEVSENCCPMFDFVRLQQDKHGKEIHARHHKEADADEKNADADDESPAYFGRVLDAGTGGHSLEWLLRLKLKGIVESVWACTGDIHRERSMRKRFKDGGSLREVLTTTGDDAGELLPVGDSAGGEPSAKETLLSPSQVQAEKEDNLRHQRLLNRARDRIFTGNWRDPDMLKGETFDVVLADYLLGSVDAFAPFFQDRLLGRLLQHVAYPDGRLYFIGMEPWPDREPSEDDGGDVHGQVIIDIAKTRDACILLAGERPYREYPASWVMRKLKHSGFEIVTVGFFEIVHSRSFVEKQISVAETKLSKISDPYLSDAMERRLKDLRSRVRSMKWGVSYGDDYVIVARPKVDSGSGAAPDTVAEDGAAGTTAVGPEDTLIDDLGSGVQPVDGSLSPRLRRRSRRSVEDQEYVFPIDDES
jgi:hypothetical protein